MLLRVEPSESFTASREVFVSPFDVGAGLVDAVSAALSVDAFEVLIFDEDFDEWRVPESLHELEAAGSVQVHGAPQHHTRRGKPVIFQCHSHRGVRCRPGGSCILGSFRCTGERRDVHGRRAEGVA
jgi:hypothetical protein